MTNLMDSLYYKDYHQIEDGLYLGNFGSATNKKIMKELNIQVVMTAMEIPLKDNEKLEGIEYHYFQIQDYPTEDILSYFPFAHDIMSKAQQEGKNVYVHCYAGMSRSATIVISYLMKKYKWKVDDALNFVKRIRRVYPNHGFLDQIKLYEKWGYEFNGRNKDYRKYLLSHFIDILKFAYLDEWCLHLIDVNTSTKYFCKIKQIDSKLSESEKGKKFLCRFCKKLLFREMNLIQNTEMNNNNCDKIFVEPQEWMVEKIEGKQLFNNKSIIRCFECSNEIGNFALATFTCICPLHDGLSDYFVVKILKNNVIEMLIDV